MYVLTLIASSNRPALIDTVAPIATLRAQLNPVRAARLSSHAIDFLLEYAPNPSQQQAIAAASESASIDAVLQPLEGRAKKLLVSDMDSTMIGQECIDELAGHIGLKEKVAAITSRAMNGELDFKAALRERVGLLQDLPESALEEVFATRITPTPGAQTLIATLRHRGVYTVLVSGGFHYFTSRVGMMLGFDAEAANQLEVANGKLTGTVAEPILDKETKRELLLHIANLRNIPLSATLAIGDGANDLPMIEAAGLGVAYHAKPIVAAAAPAQIRFNDLSAIPYLQGIPKADWVE